jgi:hypothetical protein
MLLVVAELRRGFSDLIKLNYNTGADYATPQRHVLDRLAIKRLGFWSGLCPVPPTGTTVGLPAAYEAGIVNGYDIIDGWIAIEVRCQLFHQAATNFSVFGK